jgi:predicted MFS family arabinose efflux permease
MLLIGLAMFGIFFYNSLFLQRVLGYGAIKTGATFLPMTVLIILVAPAAGKVSDRIGPRWLMSTGMILLTASLLSFSRLDVGSSWWAILPGLILGGFGMSLAMTPTAAAVIAAPRGPTRPARPAQCAPAPSDASARRARRTAPRHNDR